MSAADRIARRRSTESCVLSRSPPTMAVTIRNAYKQYRHPKTVVFEGLNLTVPRGTIYCLLGPSGCGKTTLLNCIAGQSHLDSGTVTLSISRRSEMGFMPQTVSLYQNLSVYENFFVFGYLVGMSREDIKSRAVQLIKFLNIPSGTRQLKTFSGGEQRRVSVAVTFLHDPKLLILDEPTVGLDPLLCQNIWDYMLELSSKGKTILITTHYIQEARQAHTIGLMRHGILLAEDKPSNLLIRFNTDDLEEVFLKLSLQQKIQTKEVTQNEEVRSQSVRVHFEEDESCFSNTKFSACNYKNIMILKRAFIFVIFLFVLPFSQIIFFNLTIGTKPKYLPLAVVNDEFPTMFCDPSSYKGCFLDNTENLTLSCLYLETLATDFYKFVNYNDTESALHDVRKNKVWALLYFPHNYTASLAERYSFGTQASPDAITSSNIEAWIDLSDQYIGNFIKYDTARHSTRFLERAFENCGRNPKLGAPPLSMEEPIFGSYNEDFITYAATATLCVVCFFMPFLLTGGLVFVEKSGGITERLLITGVSIKELFASILMYQIVIHVIQTIGVLCITYYVFGNPLKGSVVTLTTLLVLVGMVGSLFGLVIAAVSSSIFFVACSGVGSNLLLIITSGIAWPQEAQHYSLKAISAFIPLTLVVEASRAICAKSFPLTHPTVIKGFISAFGWGLVFLLLLTLVLKYKKNAWSGQSS